MSKKFISIPEFFNTPESLGTAVRALKNSLEILAGKRQGESYGAPEIYVQPTTPSPAYNQSYTVGDLWINTSTNTMSYWTGTTWQALA